MSDHRVLCQKGLGRKKELSEGALGAWVADSRVSALRGLRRRTKTVVRVVRTEDLGALSAVLCHVAIRVMSSLIIVVSMKGSLVGFMSRPCPVINVGVGA